MKAHTTNYKNNIKTLGREIDAIITYQGDSTIVQLGSEQLNTIKPMFKTSLLKSTMKQLEVNCNESIPLGTSINLKFGILVNNSYEYLDFGNYIVYNVEKKEDEESYTITCYDKMLYSMKDYQMPTIQYPCTLRQYIKAICTSLNLDFANEESTFVNYDKVLEKDYYYGLGYTYRDVLDEIAQATASVICINSDDELEIRYINKTNDIINEEYLKDTNVKFGEKYGPINSVVLSRSADSDYIYRQDSASVEANGLCELKIKDNQIMNGNNRDEYLDNIFTKLKGIEYYLNDYSSPGITYYDVLDEYYVDIGENRYKCLMLNDEITIDQGLEENIITEMPEVSETDYTKSDKTDRKINQTYIIVDKQNQTIEQVVNQVGEQNSKITSLTLDVNEIKGEIQNIADITVSGDGIGSLTLENVNQSEPIYIDLHPTGGDIKLLYPNDQSLAHDSLKSGTTKSGISKALSYQEESSFGLFPSETLFPNGGNVLTFTNTSTSTDYTYILPCDLLYLDSETYDEFIIDYNNQACYKIERVGFDSRGNKIKLSIEREIPYTYPSIFLTDGDYTISFSVASCYIFARLMVKNLYTDQFATKVEMNSVIDQTAQSITLEVDRKIDLVDEDIDTINGKLELKIDKDDDGQIVSMLNASANRVYLNSNRLVVNSSQFKLDASGNATFGGNLNAATGSFSGSLNASSGQIGRYQITSTYLQTGSGSSQTGIGGARAFWAGAESSASAPFNVSYEGALTATNANITGTIHSNSGSIGGLNISSGGLSNARASISNSGTISCFNSSGGSMILSNAARLSATAGVGISSNSTGNVSAPSKNIDIKACSLASVYLGCMSDSGGSRERNGITIYSGGIAMSRQPSYGSDKRLKAKIKEIKDVSWIDELKVKEYEYKTTPGEKNIGLIAQDYENKEYAKYFLNKDLNDMYCISYTDISNALILYCQQLKEQVNNQQKQIDNLQKQINELKGNDK